MNCKICDDSGWVYEKIGTVIGYYHCDCGIDQSPQKVNLIQVTA